MNFMLFYILNPEFKILKPGKMLLETEYEGKTNQPHDDFNTFNIFC